jgi:hypothetical protein
MDEFMTWFLGGLLIGHVFGAILFYRYIYR